MNRPVFAVDLDGTLAHEEGEYNPDKVGKPFDGARQFLEALKVYGDVLIYTCRTSADVYPLDALWNARTVRKWLEEHDMPFDEVYVGNGKPNATFYIDNKGVTCDPSKLGSAAYSLVLNYVKKTFDKP
jgi:hypothetical protein